MSLFHLCAEMGDLAQTAHCITEVNVDILVYVKDEIEHEMCLAEVLRVLLAAGLKRNEDKCHYGGQKEITFLGHNILDILAGTREANDVSVQQTLVYPLFWPSYQGKTGGEICLCRRGRNTKLVCGISAGRQYHPSVSNFPDVAFFGPLKTFYGQACDNHTWHQTQAKQSLTEMLQHCSVPHICERL